MKMLTKKSAIIIILILLGMVVLLIRENNKKKPIENGRGQWELHLGMTKTEVQKILGNPQNYDSDYVWIWNTTPANGHKYFAEMEASSGFFILFDKSGHLLTPLPLKTAESGVWDAYRDESGYDISTIIKLIGPPPKVVK